MANSEMQAELEKLRSEVATLKEEREARRATVADNELAPETSQERGQEQKENINSHLQELVDIFEQELRENKPLTLLIVLALGLLIGRLLPR